MKEEVLSYTTNLVVPESDRKANLQRQEIVRNPCDSNALKLLSTLTINRFRETFQQSSRALSFIVKNLRASSTVQQVWPPEALYHLILRLKFARFDSRTKSKYAYAIEDYRNIRMHHMQITLFASCEKRR